MRQQDILGIIIRSVVFVVLIGLLLWFAWAVRAILVLFVLSVIMATGLSPLVDAIAGRQPERAYLRLPRSLALLILYAGLIAGVVFLVIVVIPPIVTQADDLFRDLPRYWESAHDALRNLASSYPLFQGVEDWLNRQAGEPLGGIGDFAAQTPGVLRFALGVVNGVVAFFLVLVLTFYLVVDGGALWGGILRLLPMGSRPLANLVGERVREKMGSWLIGQLLLSTIIGVVTFIGLKLLGVPYALLLALIAAVGELIPMLGPILAAVPAVIAAAFVSPFRALLTVALYILIQQLENHLIVPQVMRRAIDLPPVVVILALLMGSELLGILGAIIALPVAAALNVLLNELIALREHNTEPEEAST